MILRYFSITFIRGEINSFNGKDGGIYRLLLGVETLLGIENLHCRNAILYRYSVEKSISVVVVAIDE